MTVIILQDESESINWNRVQIDTNRNAFSPCGPKALYPDKFYVLQIEFNTLCKR